MEADRTLPFLAAGRIKDNTVLATYSTLDADQQRADTQDVFKKLLVAAKSKLQAGSRQRLQWGEGGVYCLVDRQGSLLYVLMTSVVSYPEGLAYQLLYDLTALVQQRSDTDSAAEGGLNDVMQPRMRELVELYQDPVKYEQTVGKKARMISEDAGSASTPMISDAPRVESQQSGNNMSKMIMGLALVAVVLVIALIWLITSGAGTKTTTLAPATSPTPTSAGAAPTPAPSVMMLRSAKAGVDLLQAAAKPRFTSFLGSVVV